MLDLCRQRLLWDMVGAEEGVVTNPGWWRQVSRKGFEDSFAECVGVHQGPGQMELQREGQFSLSKAQELERAWLGWATVRGSLLYPRIGVGFCVSLSSELLQEP